MLSQATAKIGNFAPVWKSKQCNENSDKEDNEDNGKCSFCYNNASCSYDSTRQQFDYNIVGYDRCVPSQCHALSCHQLNVQCSQPMLRHHSTSHSCSNVTRCVTVTVKTRNRLRLVAQFIRSAWLYYPNLRFVVVDINEYNKTNDASLHVEWQDLVQQDNLITYLSTRPGVGFGRKMATLVAETPYVLISDDDFIFTNKTDLQKMLYILETTDIGIVGGVTDDGFPFDGLFKVYDDQRSSPNSTVLYVYPGIFYGGLPCFADCRVADIVKNFFLADRKAILSAGSWDVNRLFFEHEDFFFQMRIAHVRVASCADITIHHRGADRSLAMLRKQFYPLWRRKLLEKWRLSDYMYCFDIKSYLNSEKCNLTVPFTF